MSNVKQNFRFLIGTIEGKERNSFSEKNDCVVIALSSSTGKPYSECHKLFSSCGRKTGHRTSWNTLELTLGKIKENYDVNKIHFRGSISQFVKTFPKGNYFVCKRGHAFAINDGIVQDAFKRGAKEIVKLVYKIEDKAIEIIGLS